MKVGEIKDWLNDELQNPFAWQRVLMHLLPYFRAEGYYYHTISDEHVLNDKLISLIDKAVLKFYKVRLPQFNL